MPTNSELGLDRSTGRHRTATNTVTADDRTAQNHVDVDEMSSRRVDSVGQIRVGARRVTAQTV